MSTVRFIADYHFGHKFMAEKRGFKDTFEMNEHIVSEHNKVVRKKDITYILGDITMSNNKWYFYLDQMNGRKFIVLGNHDNSDHIKELLTYVEKVGAMIRYKGIFLTHCPIHPTELNYKVDFNIHGHVHEKSLLDKRYINVSCEAIDYKPKTIDELIPEYLKNRKK